MPAIHIGSKVLTHVGEYDIETGRGRFLFTLLHHDLYDIVGRKRFASLCVAASGSQV